MTDHHTSQAATGTGDRSRPCTALPALCATQITSWGIVYYAFPVLNARITADTNWSTTAITGASSAALLVSGVAGIPAVFRPGPRLRLRRTVPRARRRLRSGGRAAARLCASPWLAAPLLIEGGRFGGLRGVRHDGKSSLAPRRTGSGGSDDSARRKPTFSTTRQG